MIVPENLRIRFAVPFRSTFSQRFLSFRRFLLVVVVYMSTSASAAARGRKKDNQLTAEQKNEIKEAFDLFDADGYVTSVRSPPFVLPP